MNTNLFTQEDKDFLIENGYLIFDVAKLAPSQLEEAKEKLQEYISSKLFDKLILWKQGLSDEELDYINNNFPNTKYVDGSNDIWLGPQFELEEIHSYVFRNGPNTNIPQIWIEGPEHRGLPLFHEFRLQISNELYDYQRDVNRPQHGVITMFKEYGMIEPHKDTGENSERLCVITFYLNDKSEAEGNGGEIVFTSKKGEKIVIPPYFGTGVILDFAGNDGVIRNNLEHEVTPIKNNFRRYTYLSGIAL